MRTTVLYAVGAFLSPSPWGVGVNIDDLDGPSPKFLDTRTVQALDTLIARSVGHAPDGFFQVWCYAQVEKGRVTQVGVSPVVGESVRFADGGRRR